MSLVDYSTQEILSQHAPQRVPDFYIGSVPVYGDAILSPMEGFSDLPFRSLCRELGSAVSYTEFISAMQYLQNPKLEQRKLDFYPGERPVAFQIFDAEPDRLVEVALRLQERKPDIIDINMGCSTRCVSGRGAGAGLLRSPLKIARIFRRLSQALEVPVSGKIRLGWDDESLNYRLVARVIEENGGKLIAVHARTKQQGYGGKADWDAVAEVKESVSIPVVGNGDVSSAADIQAMKDHTGCDAVMIGRAAVGNPWIFSRLERDQVPGELVHLTVLRHLQHSLQYYGDSLGLVLFRKHAARYLRPVPGYEERRQSLLTAGDIAEFRGILEEIFKANQELPG
jgi:tRNA-dihydrouridine synthase B